MNKAREGIRSAGAALLTAIAALALIPVACRPTPPAGEGDPIPHPVLEHRTADAAAGDRSAGTYGSVPLRELSGPEQALGIQILSLRPTGAGRMMDLRFVVRDPERARALLSRDAKLTLIDDSTGVRAGVPMTPKAGSLRQKTPAPEEGRGYFALFFNPGQVFRPGRKVTLAAGDVQVKGLVVTD